MIFVKRPVPLLFRALLLTVVNLLLRLVGTGFGAYLSRRIGAQGIGLLQLTLSVGGLATIAGIGGIRTAAMYLTAEELGRNKKGSLPWVLSGCLGYSLVCSLTVGAFLWFFSPYIAENWIGNGGVADSLRLYSCFLPITSLCAVLTGFYTGCNRIGALAATEIAEQLFSMLVTLFALTLWAGTDPGKACRSVILGNAMGNLLTFAVLLLFSRQRQLRGERIPVAGRILRSALPLAVADSCKGGLSTLENLLVPKRLSLAVADPLAVFGRISGMVFPVLMFPACLLFGLSELLIPELARCRCAGKDKRIAHLLQKSLRASLLYGLLLGGLLFLWADGLCQRLYSSPESGTLLKLFAPLAPMLYCDAITDAMTKGLGQQHMAVRFNIFTNILDIICLYFLLPVWGINGYFISFFLTHALNFYLSLRHLLRITGEKIRFSFPMGGLLCTAFSLGCSLFVPNPICAGTAFGILFFCSTYFLGLLNQN